MNLPLKSRYGILFIDGFSIKLRRDTVQNESVYLILGVDEDGHREVLDFYISASESATLWADILQGLKRRGVKEILLGVMDGLSGIENAFLSAFPKADIQRCIVHKVRNSLAKIRKNDYSSFIQDLKAVYKSPNRKIAMEIFEELSLKWGAKYPKVIASWQGEFLD